MNITTKAVNYEASDAVLTLARERFGAAEKLLGDARDTALLEIELGRSTEHHKSGEIYRAEANLDAGGKLYRAEADADAIEKAIDKAANELLRELRSARSRTKRLIRGAGAKMKSLLRFGRL